MPTAVLIQLCVVGMATGISKACKAQSHCTGDDCIWHCWGVQREGDYATDITHPVLVDWTVVCSNLTAMQRHAQVLSALNLYLSQAP